MKFRGLIALLTVLTMLLAFASCGAQKEVDMNAAGSDYDDSYSYVKNEMDSVYDKPSLSEEISGGLGYESVKENGDYEEKLIYNVSLQAQTKEFDNALESIRSLVKALGGYEESVSTTGAGYGSESYYVRRATLKLRIPAGGLEGFLGNVRETVNVTSENIGMVNATEEYYDLEARLSVLREEQAAYEKMLNEAKDTDSLLKIKDRLYNVISEIESAKSRMNVINSRASFSTVTLTLEEVKEVKPVTTPRATFGARIGVAFHESWSDFADGFENFTVWFVGAIPTLLVLAVIFGGVAVLIVFSCKKGKKNREKKDRNVKF